ncbi:MAG: ATP-binding protein [Muribaculaceae bacterium]|nr:ATP-binding protein [Muribaculaceae bacterium]MCM1141960.1 ATP-binding protein [Muribaculum sp.]
MKASRNIIGREFEKGILKECVESKAPEFVAVYGRRRIGKTFLIKQFFKEKFDFYMTGVLDSNMSDMLEYFNAQLQSYSGREWPLATSWMKAFRQLQEYLSSLRKKKIVVFIDELPWFDTPRSRFFRALDLFWNGWGDSQSNLLFIVCGSATTWMTNKLLGDKGGLHNRVTRKIYLAPFNLYDTERMLQSVGIKWNRHQITECYMVVGGTPFYLSKMNKSQSVAQNIDRLFFHHSGELKNEYDFLFRSLFKDSTVYRKVVELIASNSMGMTREEIADSLNLSKGGNLTEVLDNLKSCDFIREYRAFGNKRKGSLFQLTDLFTLFYLKQVKGNTIEDGDYWSTHIDSSSHRSWSGYAFEQVCLHHIKQIKASIGISGVATQVSSWLGMENGKKAGQIDLVIDRHDETINLCEMKYSVKKFDITPSYLERMIERKERFREITKTRKALHLTMVTINGVVHNAQWGEIQNEVTAEQLFKE